MSKRVFIIAGIVAIIVIGIGTWAYLLLNDTSVTISEGGGDFGVDQAGSFDFERDRDASFGPSGTLTFTQALTQMTEAPVAGAVFITRNNDMFVRYVERGTGHIFEIALGSGVISRISGTTVPKTTKAMWAQSGTRVALVSEVTAYESEVFVATMNKDDNGNGVLDGLVLPTGAADIHFDSIGDTVFYTLSTDNGTTGYSRDLKTDELEVLFTIPLSYVHTLWKEIDGVMKTYVYTKPSASLDGFLYSVQGNILSRVTDGGLGLMAEIKDDYILTTKLVQDTLLSEVREEARGDAQPLAIGTYTEKCTFGTLASTTLWCTAPVSPIVGTHPDSWYQGNVSFEDHLWMIDVQSGDATLQESISATAGTPIDTTDMMINDSGTHLLFRNKIDDTLWLYDLTK